MSPRSIAYLALGLTLSLPGHGADSKADAGNAPEQQKATNAGVAEMGGQREVYSPEKYSELYKKHAPPEPESKPDSNVETLDEVVELEPYVVEGDGGLMLARFRRRWDLGTESIQRRVAELNESLGDQIQFSGRASDRFFSSQSPGSVSDRQEMFPLPTEQMKPIRQVVGEVIEKVTGAEK